MLRGITKYQRQEERYTFPSEDFVDVIVLIVCLFALVLTIIY